MSSAFESSVALGQYAHLAAAVDSTAGFAIRSSGADVWTTAHGLGTAEWFSADLVQKPLYPERISGPNVSPLVCTPFHPNHHVAACKGPHNCPEEQEL